MATGSVDEFQAQRGRMFGLAYRLLGSAEEAEDVVQDAYLRWSAADHAAIIAVPAWLARVVTNLCLNRLTSARARRERYAGPWLPEPVATADGALGPLDTAEQRESVSLAMLTLLERLTPVERAAFVLRESFGYSHREIAAILDVSEANGRQHYRRAVLRLGDSGARFAPDMGQWRRLVERFLRAAGEGDLGALEQMLAEDVVTWSDGGGKARAGRRPVVGRANVARLLALGLAKYGTDVRVAMAEVNGAPAVIGHRGGRLMGVLVVDVADGRVSALRAVLNPEKLRYLEEQLPELSHPAVGPGS
ncbi:RNA polymerase sigma-70 factor [Murinocardiopsis flavida]|uniref:RNA polymerase sigma-70 factor n=1 Tax=Murinocardiopsis flavida TaxID=645275 RepID=UPI001B80B450|nr:RNA polymerase sigma-70 factor [Murinocardiopsis flavida]